MASFLFSFLLALLFTPSFCFQLRDVNTGSMPPLPSIGHHLSSALTSLGYTQLASAIPSFSDSSLFSAWNLPVTVFVPVNDSIDASTFLINEHTVPGSFTFQFLYKLKPHSVLGTISPGRCLAFTHQDNATTMAAILVNSVPIVEPDMYNDGTLVVHGIQAPIAPLPPSSCDLPTPTADMPFPLGPYAQPSTTSVVSLMLRHAMLSLRENGYSILALAMRIRYPDLVRLQNMTVFALDDGAIFSGGHAYVHNVRFHIVPNRFLTHADLMAMPLGTVLPTLARGERLVVTSTGDGVRINYVPIRSPDVLVNLHVVVHGVFLPFPHLLHPFPSGALGEAAFQAPAAAPQEEVPRGDPFPGSSPSPSDFLEDDVL
ncbi:fasciclin-like arabinogalactan protein 21 [Nymphaea colorata]|uniref:fasciclin-like arabinogalactan protein 21 n=1 Tax=Nymphaea colorata TaxID=210225 RepID=UPI00129DFBFB|nr:fasciclin-like arabinogalactan protein 21 [Nymphaea colorata]